MIDSREQEDSTIIQDVMPAQHITNLKAGFYSKSINDTATRLVKAHPEYTYDEYAKVLNIGARSAPASKRSIGITHPSKTKKPFFA